MDPGLVQPSLHRSTWGLVRTNGSQRRGFKGRIPAQTVLHRARVLACPGATHQSPQSRTPNQFFSACDYYNKRHLVIARAGDVETGALLGKPLKNPRRPRRPVNSVGAALLVFIAVSYMTLVILMPFANIFYQAFKNGLGPFFRILQEPEFRHAAKMTSLVSLFTVPVNTIFGVLCAIMLSRYRSFPGRTFIISSLDIPFSISPVMTGLMFVLLYGRTGLFAPLLKKFGFNIIFALPGMVLGTTFVTIPFVVKTLLPVMEEWENQQEEASLSLGATEWKTFWKVTLPNIKWGLLYGVLLLNTRAMGEFGAMSVISGNIIGQTQTLTLFVESSHKEYNTDAAFAAAAILSILSVFTLLAKKWLQRKAAEQYALNKS